MKVFEPLRTYSSPRRTAVVFMRATSEPASGSERPNEQRIGSSTSGGSHVAFCSSVPAMITGAAPRPFALSAVPIAGAAPGELLADQHPVEGGEREPAVRLRERAGSSGRARAPSRSRPRDASSARRTRPPSAGSPSPRTRAPARAGPSAPPSARRRPPCATSCSMIAIAAARFRPRCYARLTSQSTHVAPPTEVRQQLPYRG